MQVLFAFTAQTLHHAHIHTHTHVDIFVIDKNKRKISLKPNKIQIKNSQKEYVEERSCRTAQQQICTGVERMPKLLLAEWAGGVAGRTLETSIAGWAGGCGCPEQSTDYLPRRNLYLTQPNIKFFFLHFSSYHLRLELVAGSHLCLWQRIRITMPIGLGTRSSS